MAQEHLICRTPLTPGCASEKPNNTPTWSHFSQEFALPIDEAVPLYNCLSRKSREAIANGVPQGSRDNTGAALARDLIGTANYLMDLGQKFAGDPLEFLETYCSRCAPPLPKKDSDRLWRSAVKSDPTPSLSPEQIENCIKGWLWREYRHQPDKLMGKFEDNGIQVPESDRPLKPKTSNAAEPLTVEELQERIRQTVSLSPTETELAAMVMTWASLSGKSEISIWQLVRLIQAEWERQESRADVRSEIDYLSRLSSYQPKAADYLAPKISEPLDRMAELMGTTSMAMLTTLLPTVGSLLPLGTELEVNPATDFKVYPIVYTGIVAESGSGKSPAQKAILKPLFRLQAEAEEEHRNAIANWELDCKEAKQNDEPTPLKPTPREYFTTDATREAVVQIQANQPNRGFLGWFDELSGLINGQNQYRSGRGSDKESLLSGRDGSAQKIDRASGKRLFISRSGYSITGSTQPDTLRGMMGNFQDSSGQWARFLWCFLPIQKAPYYDNDIPANVSEALYQTYKRLEAMPAMTYRWSPEAKAEYINWYDELDRLRMTEVKQSMRAVYAKFKGDTAVLALLLHCLNAATRDGTPGSEISVETLKAAIKLAKFYLGQVKLVHSEGEVLSGELAPVYRKILALSERKGWITARDITRTRALGKMNAPAEKIREMMRELLTMGLAESQGNGNRLAIRSIQQSASSEKSADNGADSPADNADTLITSDAPQKAVAAETPPANNADTVSKIPPTVSKLSATPQVAGTDTDKGFELKPTPTVSTVSTNSSGRKSPKRDRPYRGPARRALQVGDTCRYYGPKGGMNVTCQGRELEILAIAHGLATVTAATWTVTHKIPLRHLRKIAQQP